MNLTSEQINAVIEWMNAWEQLKDTVIPIRFKEDFIRFADAPNKPPMFFSYVESGDNFVPDPISDPYRRIPIKYGMTLTNEGNLEDAEEKIKEMIKIYVQKNTVYSHPNTEERYIPESMLPIVQYNVKDEEKPLEQIIGECETEEQLKAWYYPSQQDPIAKFAYKAKLKQLQS